MSPENRALKLQALIEEGERVLRTCAPDGIYTYDLDPCAAAEWATKTKSTLRAMYGSRHQFVLDFPLLAKEGYSGEVKKGLGIIKGALSEVVETLPTSKNTPTNNHVLLLEQLCNRFHLIARQLTCRQHSRDLFNIKDEYDVQDLMHSLLHLFFDDIRPEEFTPSYSGKSSRMDFLLKKEQIVIETKMTRPNLTNKLLGTQLIDDKERYRKHADCKTLVCFVYDPARLITNPRGIESDLSEESDSFSAHIFVRPI